MRKFNNCLVNGKKRYIKYLYFIELQNYGIYVFLNKMVDCINP